MLLWDERWSTQAVERAMIDADVSRAAAPRRSTRSPPRTYCKARSTRWPISGAGNKRRARGPLSIDSLTDAQVAAILDRALALHFAGNRGRTRRASGSRARSSSTSFMKIRRGPRCRSRPRRTASARRRLRSRSSNLGQEGRDARGYGADAQRDAPRCARHSPPREWRSGGRRLDHGCAGDQRRRRDQRTSDPGVARRGDDPPPLRKVEGLKVAICGDIRHSRVARSNAKLLPRLGAEVRLAGPPELMPDGVPPLSIDEAIDGADVVMMLRVQRERLEEDFGDAPGEYLSRYGLTAERLARAAPECGGDAPGPMNRGVEIDGAIADDPERSLITLQVEMGVAVRMACLEMLVAARLARRVSGPARRPRNCGRSSCRPGCLSDCSGRRFALGGKALDRQATEGTLGAEANARAAAGRPQRRIALRAAGSTR